MVLESKSPNGWEDQPRKDGGQFGRKKHVEVIIPANQPIKIYHKTIANSAPRYGSLVPTFCLLMLIFSYL